MAHLLLMWPLAMGWHLWRIATFRPAFEKMSDTPATTISFAVVFFAAGLSRHAQSQPIFMVALGLIFWAVVLAVLFERSDRSSSMFCSALGCSTIVDLACTVFGMSTWMALFMEVTLLATSFGGFLRQPAEVRARGYGRR
jgi:hypothetical protein